MANTSKSKLMRLLADNAVDFLKRAIDDFKQQPKYSIINFYTAVELLLKARLLHEHWSLIVGKEPDRQRFESGDFVSVTFDVACDRLHRIVQSPVPEGARKNFDAIRRHRNKMVHFFHEADRATGDLSQVASVAGEQLRAWYDLHKLLTTQWAPVFKKYEKQFEAIEQRLHGHKEFLRAKFQDLTALINSERSTGIDFRDCGSCGFRAARTTQILGSLLESDCLVCRYRDRWFELECPSCSSRSELREGGEFECQSCNAIHDQKAIVDHINEFVVTKDNYFEAHVPANCSECEGYHSVVEYAGQYLCIVCFFLVDEVASCDWCSEFGNGDMDDSNMVGCSVCGGSMGHLMSKDD